MNSSKIRIQRRFPLFALLMLLLVISTAGHLVFLSFYALVIISATSCLYLRLLSELLHIELHIENRIFRAGDTVSWQLSFESRLPVSVMHVFQYKNGNCIVAKKGSITLDENFWIEYSEKFFTRGIYDIGTIEVQVHDLFGIMTLHIRRSLGIQLKVYPALYRVSTENTGNDIFMDMININAKRENQYMISDIRKYVTGDSTKKIHWKVSARHNELFVRKYESTSGISIVVLADFSRSNYSLDTTGEIEERIADTAGSLVLDAARIGINADVYIHSSLREHHQITSIYRFHEFIEQLTITPSAAERDFSDFVTRELARFDRMTRIFIICALPDETVISLIRNRYFQYDITLIHCDESENTNAIHYSRVLALDSPGSYMTEGQ